MCPHAATCIGMYEAEGICLQYYDSGFEGSDWCGDKAKIRNPTNVHGKVEDLAQ